MALASKKRQRSCIGCGTTTAKGTLLRVVRNSEGAVSFDATGRAPGRGAYVCSPACFAAAWKARKLDRALRVKLTEEDYRRIAGQIDAACGSETNKTEE